MDGRRNEHLIYEDELGRCRQCERVIGKKDKRNLCIGLMSNQGAFITTAILVTPCGFRCPSCRCRHRFEPFAIDNAKQAA